MLTRNLLTGIPETLQEEQYEILFSNPGGTLQRIISPPGFRSHSLRQAEDEWILLLQGEAILQLQDKAITLQRGDSLLIAAGMPHRVLATSSDPLCIWLALHLPETGT